MIYSEPNNLRLKTFRSRLRYCSQVLGSIIGKKGIKTLVFLYMCIFILNPRKVHINDESLRSISKSFVYYTETHRRLYSTPYFCEYLRGLHSWPLRSVVLGWQTSYDAFLPCEVLFNPKVYGACPATTDGVVIYDIYSRPRAYTLKIMGQVFVLDEHPLKSMRRTGQVFVRGRIAPTF